MAIIKIASKRRSGRWSRKRTIIIGIVVVVLIVGGAVAWWLIWGANKSSQEGQERGRFEVLDEERQAAQSRYDDRAKTVDEASLTKPEDKYLYHMARSDDFMMMGRYSEAVAAIEEAGNSGVELDQAYYFALGNAYEGDGNMAQAEQMYQKSYDLAAKDKYADEYGKQAVLDDIRSAIDRVKQ